MGVVLLSILCFSAFWKINGEYVLEKVELPSDDKNVRYFTDDDIALYDGSDPKLPLLMAVKGVVFDVSTAPNFYGPKASYNALTGKDCTRAVAKMSLEPSDLNRDLTGLSDRTLKDLETVFKQTYMEKYPVVGYMDYLIEERRSEGERVDL